MRSLTSKLTLAFIVVGLLGALSVAAFTWQRTRSAFDRFIQDRDRLTHVQILGGYYASNDSWEGVWHLFRQPSPLADNRRQPIAVANSQGVIVHGAGPYETGTVLSAEELQRAVAITVNGEQVGWYIGDFAPPRLPWEAPESRFLANLRGSTLLSALLALFLAVVLGAWLSRSLTQPIRELTAATRKMARGELGQQVPVRSQDELGELAGAFNQMSKDLEQATEARRQMTADVAHDLRTPLTVLLGYTEPLQDGTLEGSPELYSVLHEEVLQLKRLVEDLRTLSLADAGRLSLERRPVDPQALLERTGLAFMALAQQKDVDLQVEAEKELPSINVDVARMTQVLQNLVSNALRYTPAGGQITLSVALDGASGQVRLAVRDSGPGISPQDLPHIFSRFYRADQSRERSTGASGLGLAIARSIVEAHGGTIHATSAPGEGSTFTIVLATHQA